VTQLSWHCDDVSCWLRVNKYIWMLPGKLMILGKLWSRTSFIKTCTFKVCTHWYTTWHLLVHVIDLVYFLLCKKHAIMLQFTVNMILRMGRYTELFLTVHMTAVLNNYSENWAGIPHNAQNKACWLISCYISSEIALLPWMGGVSMFRIKCLVVHIHVRMQSCCATGWMAFVFVRLFCCM
jgi:hypothetical protein